MSDIIWCPSDGGARDSAMQRLAERRGLDLTVADGAAFDQLHAWSISDASGFWDSVWDLGQVIGDKGTESFRSDPTHPMTGAQFYPDSKINIAENLLRRTGSDTVVIETDEAGHVAEISADKLRSEVARIADGLRQLGVEEGDRVATVLPNRLECLIVYLATASLGAVWTSCSPDFGPAAILDRIGQVRPKVLFAQSHIRYGGKQIDLSGNIEMLVASLPGLAHLVLIDEGPMIETVPVSLWANFGTPVPLIFHRVDFNAPCYILYTSGTTGAPKAIVHRTGGVLLQHVKEHLFHGDVRRDDRFLWYTNTAWMMYHWVVSVLACDAVLVLYDGAPILKAGDGIDGAPLWKVAEEVGLTHLGISPKYLSTLADNDFSPKADHDLSALRWLMSAGSPVASHQYDWIQEEVGKIGFASISGGTELMGCFLLGSPHHPLRRGKLTVKGLGMAVSVLDSRGVPVIGRSGDLVCTEPFPSMPLTFWGENGRERYFNSYFAERAEVWTHGDHATMHADSTAVIHGRSDCTLNPGGVRIGTADIYNICEQFEEIEDCIVFGRPIEGDEEIVLCLKPAQGQLVTADLAARVRKRLRSECSPRHVPAAIFTVSDIPQTINGKRVEGAARSVVSGQVVKNLASLSNAACLEEYSSLSLKEPL